MIARRLVRPLLLWTNLILSWLINYLLTFTQQSFSGKHKNIYFHFAYRIIIVEQIRWKLSANPINFLPLIDKLRYIFFCIVLIHIPVLEITTISVIFVIRATRTDRAPQSPRAHPSAPPPPTTRWPPSGSKLATTSENPDMWVLDIYIISTSSCA